MPNHMRWAFTNKADEDTTDIDIFDVIGGDGFWEDGISAKDFVEQMRAVTTSKINLHINSPGGYVNDGKAMYNAIQQHDATVTAYVESEAASAASFVAMAADKVVIAKNANIMIHDALTFCIGNAGQLRTIADELDAESNTIAQMYADKAGGDAVDWRAAMQANGRMGTTYRGQEAVDAGLADEVLAKPAHRNLQELRVAAMRTKAHEEPAKEDPDPFDELLLASLPPLADHAGYRAPQPDLEGLLGKHPLTFAGKGA